jgi:DNA-binding NarL/FixJ family response regulator
MTDEADPLDLSETDTRRWLRDMGAIIALPALWVDHSPHEIATSLLSVLSGILQLEAAYAGFDTGDVPLHVYRPSDGPLPTEFVAGLEVHESGTGEPGLSVTDRAVSVGKRLRVASIPVSLPWETGIVMVSASRSDFPTAMETHLLRVAVSQASIAIHTARRLAHERTARAAAEDALRAQTELFRSLIRDVAPALERAAQTLDEADRPAVRGHLDARGITPTQRTSAGRSSAGSERPSPGVSLSHREIEVLGLLAQGLSNKEIAGVLWLSDRTVERHITGLYRKIGVARRSEATAFALRHGMG